MIDDDGFRANVGIILSNCDGEVFWGKRIGQTSWQFPQGGIDEGETPLEAMFRELHEETGLREKHVQVVGSTQDWLRYRLPNKMVRRCNNGRVCIGQKQRWFILRFVGDDDRICTDRCDKPEFDRVRWVQYWRPVNEVIYFKRRVYARALHELGPFVFADGPPRQPRWWPKRWRVAFDKDVARIGETSDELQIP